MISERRPHFRGVPPVILRKVLGAQHSEDGTRMGEKGKQGNTAFTSRNNKRTTHEQDAAQQSHIDGSNTKCMGQTQFVFLVQAGR